MADVYLSPGGSDTAAGTEAAPWRTLARLNTALAAGLGPGDTINFARNGLFYGRVLQPGTNDVPAQWTTFQPYGAGEKPRLACYKRAIGPWHDEGDGTWSLDLGINSGQYDGDRNGHVDVGHLMVDDVLHGRIFLDRSGVTSGPQWSFWSDVPNTRVHVRSSANPATLAQTILISVQGPWTPESQAFDSFTPTSRTRILDLDVSGSSGTGVIGHSYWTSDYIEVLGCDFHHIGGGLFHDFYPGTRGGNGIMPWIGNKHWRIENNRIWQCFDAAISYQGGQGTQTPDNTDFVDLHSRRNIIFNNCQSFETWHDNPTTAPDGAGFVDCSFTDNYCFGAGRGWGQAVRIDPTLRGTHLQFYQHELPGNDLLIARNVFYDAVSNYINTLAGIPDGMTLRDNYVYLAPGIKIQASGEAQWDRPETVEQAAAYVAATGHEQGTTWFASRPPAETFLAALTASGVRVIPTTAGLRALLGEPGVTWPDTSPG